MKLVIALLTMIFVNVAHAGFFTVDLAQQLSITATVTSTKVLDTSTVRNYILIQNTGSVSVIIKFGSVQSATEGIVIPAGGSYEPSRPIRQAMWIKSASSTAAVTILTGN